jgi:3-hydroxyisobutyrate dehydrogenase
MQIGLAGTGRMGAAIVQRLIDQGHTLTVWNRTREKAAALEAKGAKVAATPAELAARSEAIITILTNAAAIDAAYNGPDGLLSGDVRGKLFIEMSTVRPETQKSLAMTVKGRGAAFVECPVGGTIGPARDGKLLGFAGGDEADFARAQPLLGQMCRRVEYMGASGAGAAMKLAINLPLLVFWQSFGEAMSLVKALGVSPERLVDIFSDSSGGPNVLKARGPALAKALKGEPTGPTTFNIDSIRKDLATMIEEAQALGYDTPVTRQALAAFDKASAEGHGDGDGVTLPALWLARKH